MTLRKLMLIITAGRPALSSQYGHSRAGVAAYDIRCKGSEIVLGDCSIDKCPLSAFLCRDSTSNAAGVVCTYTRIIINPSNQRCIATISNLYFMQLLNIYVQSMISVHEI